VSERALRVLADAGERAVRIGEVVTGVRGVELVT
jgi:hypothetical protein